MERRRLLPLAAALAVALTPAAPATARSGDGVTVDPNSPTGKEYAIPLQSARRDATQGTDTPGRAPQGERSVPLFGEGVGDSPAQSGSSSGGSSLRAPRSSHEQPQRSSKRSADGGTVQDAIAGTRTVRATVPDGGAGSVLTIGAVALSVLLLGAVLGSIARRRAR